MPGNQMHRSRPSTAGLQNSGMGRKRGLEELSSYSEEKSLQVFL
jgi:hypothetical protein